MNDSTSRTWIRRFANHSYSRPMTEVELLELIHSGSMNPTDELCAANDYWFSVQDVQEMRKHFGEISMDGMFRKIKEEVTEERMADTARIVLSELRGSAAAPVTPVMKTKIESPMKEDSRPGFKLLMIILFLLVLMMLVKFFS